MAQNGQPTQPGEPAFCANVDLTKRCLTAVFGKNDLTRPNWQKLLTDCGILFVPEDQVKELRGKLLAQMKLCTNIYSSLNSGFFLETFLTPKPQNATDAVRESFESLLTFCSNDLVGKTTTIMNAMTDQAKIQTTIDKTSDMLKNPKDKNSIDAFAKLFGDVTTYYPDIVSKIQGLTLNNSVINKAPFLCLMLFMFHIASKKGISVLLNDNLLETGDVNVTDMNSTFSKPPSSLDARQFITVNRFTKYRKQCDKACFLFHGVGTGKTMTSTTIALAHLSDVNKFSTTHSAAGGTGPKPLQVLVVCPQGLFFGAFQGDAEKLSIYTYNRIVYSASSVKDGITYEYQFEQFDACVKVDETSYYKIRFTGFDYINLFKKEYALEKLGETKYDVLICDEAHKIITEKLKPESQIGYDINFNPQNKAIEGNRIDVKPVTENDPTVCAINDIRFVDFVKDNIIKQSIFLTGTPIQKTPYDIVSIVKFLNLKGINESNNKKLCDDVNRVAPTNSKYYFNKLDPQGDAPLNTPTKKSWASAGLAELYLFYQYLSKATVEDLEATLRRDGAFKFSDYFGIFASKDIQDRILMAVNTITDQDLTNIKGQIATIINKEQDIIDIARYSADKLDEVQVALQNETFLNQTINKVTDAFVVSITQNLKKNKEEIIQTLKDELPGIIKEIENKAKDAGVAVEQLGKVNNTIEDLFNGVLNTQGFGDLLDILKANAELNSAQWNPIKKQVNDSLLTIFKKNINTMKTEITKIKNTTDQATATAHATAPATAPATPKKGILSRGIKGLFGRKKPQGGGGEEKEVLVKYVSELPEQSLTLKTEMGQILSNFDGSTLIDTTPVMQIIVKDTGIPQENINKTISYLYDCLNGKVPYEKAVEVLSNEKVVAMLNPLLGPNWVFLENPSSRTSSEITLGGKKRKQTIRKKYFKKSKTRKNKYVGGVLSITDGRENDSKLVIQNINNEVFVKEMPILLGLYLYNFGTTLDEQLEYFTEKVLQQFTPNKNSTSPINISDVETFKYAEKLLTTYILLNYSKQDNPSTADVEELDDSQDGGAPPGKGEVFEAYVKNLWNTATNSYKESSQRGLDIRGIALNILFRAGGPAAAHFFGAGWQNSAAFVLTPEVVDLTLFLAKIGMNVTNFVIGQILGEFNLDGMIENIMPFVSIYNYDYITTAIDNKEFFTNLLKSTPQFKLSETVNEKGTTNAFPDKFIENICFPFTQQQVREIHNVENKMLKKLFAVGNVNLSKEVNAKLSYKLSNALSNISCGVGEFDNDAKVDLLNKYIAYFKKSAAADAAIAAAKQEVAALEGEAATEASKEVILKMNENRALGFLEKKQEQYKRVSEFDSRLQLYPAVNVSINKFIFESKDIDKLVDKKRMPINISGNFVDFRKDEVVVGVEESPSYLREDEIVTKNVNTINNFYFDTLRSKLRANTGDIQDKVKFLQENPYEKPPYKDGIQTKFENVLELLKIVRSGVIFQGQATEVSRFSDKNFDSKSQFVYHPHYALVRENNTLGATGGYDEGTVEYYLPVIYPPTDEVMYGFCDFLDKKGYKYIWLNDKLDPFNLDAQLNFGTIFTFPIKPYDSLGDNNPICIVLSPPHKEGFSFTFNPVLISLGLSETAGDEEQIYGRVLRKYGKDALDGKYGKKIYQYFSGGNKDTATLPTLTSLYSLDIKTVFRGMYDSRGYSQTTAGSFGAVGNSIWLSVMQGYDGLQYNTWVSSEASRAFLANSGSNPIPAQEYLDKYFPILDLTDELQLKLLYNVKYVSLEFFKKIAIKENAKLQPSFGARINPLNLWYGVQKPPFHPIDVQEMITVAVDRIPEKNEEMRNTVKNSLKYCMENLNGDPKLPDFKLYNGDALNIKSALVCLQKGIACPQPPPVGGNKKHKTTKRRNAYKKNKRTRKYKK